MVYVLDQNGQPLMPTMRWEFYNRLKALYGDMVHMTFGYITKYTRINYSLPKEHYIDARCISGNPDAVSNGEVFYQKKVRCHNRQIHKFSIQKGGTRKNNQAPYKVKGFRLFDKVKFKGIECFIFSRRTSGSFDIRTLDGIRLSAGVSYKKLSFLEPRKSYLTERRSA